MGHGKVIKKCQNLNVSNPSCHHLFMSIFPYHLFVSFKPKYMHLNTYNYFKKYGRRMSLGERQMTIIICARLKETAVMTSLKKTRTTNLEIAHHWM